MILVSSDRVEFCDYRNTINSECAVNSVRTFNKSALMVGSVLVYIKNNILCIYNSILCIYIHIHGTVYYVYITVYYVYIHIHGTVYYVYIHIICIHVCVYVLYKNYTSICIQ